MTSIKNDNKVKFEPELFYPFSPFLFANEDLPDDKSTVIIEDYIKTKRGYIKPGKGITTKFNKPLVKFYFLKFLFNQDFNEIDSFLNKNYEKSLNKGSFTLKIKEFYDEQDLEIKHNLAITYSNTKVEMLTKRLQVKRWLDEKLEINNIEEDMLSLNGLGADTTTLVFLLLGRYGIIRRFFNKSEFGELIEQMTKHKKKKLAEYLDINSEDNFHKRPNAKKKIDQLIAIFEEILTFLRNERVKIN